MLVNHLIAITLAYIIDRIIGDPVSLPHPVRMIGKGLTFLERTLNRGRFRRLTGSIVVLIITIITLGLTFVLTCLAYEIHRVVGIGVESLLIATTIATKGLAEAANEVYRPLVSGDLLTARRNLSMIVGRDTEQLVEEEMTRATVETIAENTSDGITAPLFWALIGGAPLAVVYRAINTCDSMFGYTNERFLQFGWASARLDDIVNYIPSRFTGFLMVIVNKPAQSLSRHDCIRILFRDAKKHASPNSGWLEAAAAALLGVQLGGASTYNGVLSERPQIGKAIHSLEARHIAQMISMMHRTVIATIVLFWLGGGMIAFT